MKYLQIKTLYIEVTHACNQHCKHCYLDGGIHNKVAEMSTEQIKKILKEFKEQGGRYIILTGGEPIMRKDIFEIMDYIEELEIPFNFASNGLAMSQEKLKKLATQCTFGKAYESLKIPKDKKLMNYIELLRKAEEATLKEAETSIVEFDETVDKYIRVFSQK
ncbi:4Fe-4S single cluster domain-containing protein [Hathewaya proteolytica DSM 3090]|uniref:4Fe-4S single cluster domain-containing protein n=1 Tax=Hathewaya proteolytica DSM 3090 TaxID=1121331 RepID=A0A1M6M0D5_9CLOT|nr:radical SAM protein [Hathewaya proteolytica]SHJ76947.1 4Fe-4S single cluster domain-containing protein [Hathewaya proteolytica DSM 3090]